MCFNIINNVTFLRIESIFYCVSNDPYVQSSCLVLPVNNIPVLKTTSECFILSSSSGIGGSGRASAARLASFMAMYELFSIEITKNYTQADWRDDIRQLMRKAGDEGCSTVFLFGDHQIKVTLSF